MNKPEKNDPSLPRQSEAAPDDDWHLRGYLYASKQGTHCAGCGQYKHTPLRVDEMGGYVCLTCIDKELERLLDTTPAAHGVGLQTLPPAGFVLVPVEPTEAQWSGLARDVVMWMQAYQRHDSNSLLKHLDRCGTPIPEWLKKEADTGEHSLPKGTIAAIIYKAMLQAASAPGADHG